MNTFIALLRAVNVGGIKLPMATLRQLCEDAGFTGVCTYVASGNVVFCTRLGMAKAKATLEARLEASMGRPVPVLMRTALELEQILAANPFPDAPANRVIVYFFDEALPANSFDTVKHQKDEQLQPAGRELYVHYPEGMGTSKLVIPAAAKGTGRNLNTVRALRNMAIEA